MSKRLKRVSRMWSKPQLRTKCPKKKTKQSNNDRYEVRSANLPGAFYMFYFLITKITCQQTISLNLLYYNITTAVTMVTCHTYVIIPHDTCIWP